MANGAAIISKSRTAFAAVGCRRLNVIARDALQATRLKAIHLCMAQSAENELSANVAFQQAAALVVLTLTHGRFGGLVVRIGVRNLQETKGKKM